MKCRSCSSEDIKLILDLGNQPWCNDFLHKSQLGNEHTYPLRLCYCNQCELLQLDTTVPKETMFKNHTYVSGTTKTLAKHFYDLAVENQKFIKDKNSLIVDIGGNDGTQLLQYKKLGYTNVANVESADNISLISVQNGVNTFNAFFNEEWVDIILPKQGKAKLINASGVFFHLEELHSVIRGIKKLLDDDGIFVIQFMYAGDMIDKLQFDGIYHEHLCYYTLKSLSNLLAPYGLRIFNSFHSEIHGGSMVVRVCHNDSDFKTDDFTKSMIKNEDYSLEKIEEFAKKITSSRGRLKSLLQELKNQKKKIYAYGAPAKGNTLLN